MQTDNRILDDMARMTMGAASLCGAAREEARARMRQRAESLLARMDLVRREEFEVVRDMAVLARRENERLEQRIAELEAGRGAPRKRRKADRGRSDAP